jgi:hypothetical protein
MLTLISSIPTTVREGFDVQDLPPRASIVSQNTLENVFGGASSCLGIGASCNPNPPFLRCCPGSICSGFTRRCRRFLP